MDNNLEVTPAEEWCYAQLGSYDVVSQTLQELKESNATGLIYNAKLNRAERMLKLAEAKANAADLVRILMNTSANGEMYIDIPSADIKVRIKW